MDTNKKKTLDEVREIFDEHEKERKSQFPMTISGIEIDETTTAMRPAWRAKNGDLVRVRPCAEEYGNKTYLGIMIGDVAQGFSGKVDPETKALKIGFSYHNPLIFIPETKTTVTGSGSWWGKIESEDDLKDITNDTIENQWYVKMLKEMKEKS